MRRILIFFILFLIRFSLEGQVKNSGFEFNNDSLNFQPGNWRIKKVAGFFTSIDSTQKFSGKLSFKINNEESENKSQFFSFSQEFPIRSEKTRKIILSAHIKADKLQGNVALWARLVNKSGENTGFGITYSSDSLVHNGWQTYSLILAINRDAEKMIVGGGFKGIGTAWYDDFSFRYLESGGLRPNKRVLKYSHQFNEIVRHNSIYSDSLDWKQIDADLRELSTGLKTTDDARFLNDYVLQKLKGVGDNHSFVVAKAVAKEASESNLNAQKVTSRLMNNGEIGYLFIPGFFTTNSLLQKDFANNIQNIIRNLADKQAIKGWIIDLRQNTGGDMYPMIAGLGPLFKVGGTLGYFIKRDGLAGVKNRWFYDNGRVGYGSDIYCKVDKPYEIKNKDFKVAIIISSQTASSGEMLAVSFMGDENVKVFGQSSAGFLTGNSDFKLSDGAHLYLATSFTTDRNRKQYAKLHPDFLVKSEGKTDSELEEARSWIVQ